MTQQTPAEDAAAPAALLDRWLAVRRQTEALAAPLSAEDAQAQSMPDASPAKWHLAHVTWFIETLVLARLEPDFRPFDAQFPALFNSYYQSLGERHPRPQRGLLTRPSLARVRDWRADVDQRVTRLAQQPLPAAARWMLELGLQHEQQHQELLLTDVLHLFSCNALEPAYSPAPAPDPAASATPAPLQWQPFEGGLVEIGHANGGAAGADGNGFAFDNETPRHRHWLAPYALAQRLVTQGEWADFIADGGYRDPRWWLSAGWDWVQAQAVQAPLYWRREDRGFSLFGLHGRQPLQPAAPVLHLSFYEAEAYARWAGAQQPGSPPPRLPTEAEWEHAAAGHAVAGNLLEAGTLGPRPAPDASELPSGLQQLWGDAWEWTRSAYAPYPGYRPWDGAVGEYNGKFMADQFVLRGGSFATPRSHVRASYRNFFPAPTRWQFAGLRLARDAG